MTRFYLRTLRSGVVGLVETFLGKRTKRWLDIDSSLSAQPNPPQAIADEAMTGLHLRSTVVASTGSLRETSFAKQLG